MNFKYFKEKIILNLNMIELIFNQKATFIKINSPNINTYWKIEDNLYQELKFRNNNNLDSSIFKELKKYFFSSFIGEFKKDNIKYLIFCENCSYELNINNIYNIYCVKNIKIFDCKNKIIDDNFSNIYTELYNKGFFFSYNYNLSINLFSPYDINKKNLNLIINKNYIENYIKHKIQYFLVSLVYGQIIYHNDCFIFIRYSHYKESYKYKYIIVDLGYFINFDYFFTGFVINEIPKYQESYTENLDIYNIEVIKEKYNELKSNFKIQKNIIFDKGIKNLKNGHLLYDILNKLKEDKNYFIHTIEKKFMNNKYLELINFIDIIKNNEYNLDTCLFLPEYKKYWLSILNPKLYLKKIICYIATIFILKCQNAEINKENNIFKVSNLIYNQFKEYIEISNDIDAVNQVLPNTYYNYSLIKNIIQKFKYNITKKLSFFIINMNVGGFNIKELKSVKEVIDDVKILENDILVFNLQEVISMDKSNIHNILLNLGGEENYWKEIFCKKLDIEYDYNLIFFNLLGGLLTMILVKKNCHKTIKLISYENIKMGALGIFANKGSIIVKIEIENYSFILINCHLAAGYDDKSFNKRLENLELIYNKMLSLNGDFSFICGDLNFRCKYDEIYFKDLLDKYKKSDNKIKLDIIKEYLKFDELLPKLKNFKNLKEEKIKFLPSYKFMSNGLDYNYDKKNRMPSYCDRILYHIKEYKNFKMLNYNIFYKSKISDHKPIYLEIEINLEILNQEKLSINWNYN